MTVAYPIQSSTGLGMSVAEVVEVFSGVLRLRTQRRDGQVYHFNFTRLDRVVIAEGSD